jgi:hypothetical protein
VISNLSPSKISVDKGPAGGEFIPENGGGAGVRLKARRAWRT